MGAGLSVKTSVVGGIAVVAVVSQLISGTGQYLDRMAMGREQIRQINEAVLQPVSELAARGINGGNQMVLTDQAAASLYKASGVRYLAMEGMSEGAPKTAFTEAIPPQKVTHEYIAEGASAERLKAIAQSASSSGLNEKEYIYVIRTNLPEVKNGGRLVAAFSAQQLSTLSSQTLKEVVPLALGVVALALVLAWFIGGRIALPITRLAIRVGEVAHSLDLSGRITISEGDLAFNREAGDTARAFNGLLEKLHETLSDVLNNVTRVNEAVGRVSSLSGMVAERSEQQSSSSSQMAAAMEQSTANLSEIASNAGYLDKSSRESGALSANGASIIRKAGDEMGVIARTVQEGAASIDELGRQSDEISAIVQVIREIADQTNLLALNAAIEAARAGEQGRGFAVVADEVRKLAERTSQSTTQITGMIAAIQGSSKNAVGVMEDTVKRVSGGVSLAGQAGNAITEISNSNEHVINGVKAISEALRQQNTAYQEIQHHVERVAQMTEENSYAASDTARAAGELEGLSRSMREAVSKFKL